MADPKTNIQPAPMTGRDLAVLFSEMQKVSDQVSECYRRVFLPNHEWKEPATPDTPVPTRALSDEDLFETMRLTMKGQMALLAGVSGLIQVLAQDGTPGA